MASSREMNLDPPPPPLRPAAEAHSAGGREGRREGEREEEGERKVGRKGVTRKR